MYPTIVNGDRIVANTRAYQASQPRRGDIVVFYPPLATECGGSSAPESVQRVIGLPGDVLSAHGGYVYVNGNELKEPWLPKTSAPFTKDNRLYTTAETYLARPYRVPSGDYFVVGDD